MAATVQASSNASTPLSSPSITVPLPTGWQAGDVLYIAVELVAAAGTISAPTGYSTVVASFNSSTSTSASMAVFRKVLTASESDPIVSTTSGRSAAVGILVRGADNTTPEDVAATSDTGSSWTGASGSVVAPSITPAATNDLLLCFWGERDGTNGVSATFTAPADMTIVDQATSAVAGTSNASIGSGQKTLTSSAATGTETATATAGGGTMTTAANTQGVSVVVRAAGGSSTQTVSGAGAIPKPTMLVVANTIH